MFARGFAVEVLHQPPLPGRRQIKCGDKSGEQADVASANLGRGDAELRRRFQSEREHFGIGSRLVLPAERLDADLKKFSRRTLAVTKYRADIAKPRRPAGS